MNIDESKSVSSDKSTRALALEDYDLFILGYGTGATFAAWTFASRGQRVALIERNYIGRLVPGHRLSHEQEHHYSECEGSVLLSSRQGVRCRRRRLPCRHAGSAGSKARDGIGLGQYVSR